VIAHVVLLTPRADLSAAERRGAIEQLTRAVAAVPEILRCRVGRRVSHGAGYEALAQPPYEIALLLEFGDLAALQRYLQAPAHGALGEFFSSGTSAAVAYDFEIVEPSAAGTLLI
jgi:hypothetical protein